MTASEAAVISAAAVAATTASNTQLLEAQIAQAASTGAYETLVYSIDNPAYQDSSAFMTPANKYDLEQLGFTVSLSYPSPPNNWYDALVSWSGA